MKTCLWSKRIETLTESPKGRVGKDMKGLTIHSSAPNLSIGIETACLRQIPAILIWKQPPGHPASLTAMCVHPSSSEPGLLISHQVSLIEKEKGDPVREGKKSLSLLIGMEK